MLGRSALLAATNSGNAGDPYYSSVSLLLRNSLTDESPSPKTITAFGNAAVSATTVKYGTGSIAVNGASGYITTSSSASLGLGAEDFSIELWVYMTSAWGATGIFGFSNGYGLSSFSGGLSLWQSGGAFFQGAATIPQNQWTHIAVTREGTVLRIFTNGVQRNTIQYAINIGNTNSITIGYHPNEYNQSMTGFIDDFRITKGICLYNANFTPPPAELPNY